MRPHEEHSSVALQANAYPPLLDSTFIPGEGHAVRYNHPPLLEGTIFSEDLGALRKHRSKAQKEMQVRLHF